MKRIQLRRHTPLVTRSRLTRRRRVRAFANYEEELATKRVILLREPCVLCHGRSQHIHHRRLRSQGGDNDFSNLLPMCWRCHDAVHANQAGLIVGRTEDPRRVPITLTDLPTAQRIRLVRPIFDWRAMQRQINEENAVLGPDLDSVPDQTDHWI